MSKIQKALSRIQAARGTATSKVRQQPDENGPVIVANLVDLGPNTKSFSDSGKRLHVDHDELRAAGFIAPEYHEHLLADQYRDIKRPLIAHAFGKRATRIDDGNLIVVSSALPSEGKTFMSINLALSMAQERDYDVLLVDADVAKSSASEIFGAKDELGLLDVLEDSEIPVQSLLLPTDVDGLSILPAGQPRHGATELFASTAMEDLISTLAQLRDGQIVIFDSPPLLQTSEAKVLSSLAGQVVIVVRAEETAQEAVVAALALFDETQAVNLVLNQVRAGFDAYQYGYGYGYGYGRGKNGTGEDK
jgi:exopolysaccharide/PEP-CTERM locus tyrosine autokinase